MVEQMHRRLPGLSRRGIITALGLGIIICFSASTWSQPKKRLERNRRTYQSLNPEEKANLNRKLQRWKSLPPEKQRVLRHRMEKWRELSPEDRQRYRHRFNQWQNG
jgi:hypothetical protein